MSPQGVTSDVRTTIKHDVLTVQEAATTLRIGRTTMYRLIKSGAINSIKIGKKILIPAIYLQRFIEERSNLCYNQDQIDSRSCYEKGDYSNESNRKFTA